MISPTIRAMRARTYRAIFGWRTLCLPANTDTLIRWIFLRGHLYFLFSGPHDQVSFWDAAKCDLFFANFLSLICAKLTSDTIILMSSVTKQTITLPIAAPATTPAAVPRELPKAPVNPPPVAPRNSDFVDIYFQIWPLYKTFTSTNMPKSSPFVGS